MSAFLLVHGAWGGAWCWERKLAPVLRAMGHLVLAPDLPGHGGDSIPPSQIGPTTYVEAISTMLSSASDAVVLVGHSMGGIVISQVAERNPAKVRKLVYLAAFLVPSGQCLADLLKRDTESLLIGNIIRSEDRTISRLRDSAVKEALYGECSEADVEFAKALLCPEPAAPSRAKLELSDARFGSVPRAYVECLRDRAVTPSLQRSMQVDLPCREIARLDTDHSPFFSKPLELAEILSTFGALKQ